MKVMKNIHILPTDSYSPLVYSTSKYGGLFLSKYYSPMKVMGDSYQHIYITSPNEDINENDYIITKDGRLVEVSYLLSNDLEGASKIVLTTDPMLSPDVHKIPDEFLQWFVKNPSCEEVKVELKTKQLVKPYDVYNEIVSYYKIIIPEEEPKPNTCDIIFERAALIDIEESKQERTYSEEDIRNAYFAGVESTGEGWNGEYAEGNDPIIEEVFKEGFENWFEQFKKK